MTNNNTGANYKPLTYSQHTTLAAVKRTGRITPRQSKSLVVLMARDLVVYSNGALVLTARGAEVVQW